MNKRSTLSALDAKRKNVETLLKTGGPQNRLLPLSPYQKRTWDYLKLNPTSTVHNISFQIQFEGNLNPEILEKSLIKLVTEQESLRIRVVEGEHGPFQFLTPADSLAFKTIDLRGQNVTEQEKTIAEMIDQNSQTAFDFSIEPVFSVSLIFLSKEKCLLLFRTFQLACDGIGIFFIIKDLQKFYLQLLEGNVASVPLKQFGYLDFVEKQIAFFESDQIQNDFAYWKKELQGAPQRLIFPEGQVVEKQERVSTSGQLLLEARLYQEVQDFCKKQGVTPFVFMFSVFNLALYRWTGKTDFLVRSIINNRANLGEETWGMVGDFTNPFAFYARIEPNTCLRDLLRRTHEKMMDAYSHSGAPFRSVVEATLRDQNETLTDLNDIDSFTNVYLIMHNLKVSPELDFGKGLIGYPSVHLPRAVKKPGVLDLVCQIFALPTTLSIHYRYNSFSLQPDQVEKFIQSLPKFIKTMIDHSDKKISQTT